jgi:hypothetical protein
MADFRKWFLAFAVTALLCAMAVPASAQTVPQPLACTANAGQPPTIRAEGLTELVGDVVLRCTGGEPTANGQVVPQANITVALSTNITSRIIDSPWTEALLIVDEPHSAVNPAVPLKVCGDTGAPDTPTGSGVCQITSIGNAAQTYNGTNGHPNVFQGRRTADNQITFFGVPVDPPGTQAIRSYRITNVRSNASQLGVSSTLVPSQVTMYISITGNLPIQNPQITVAYVQVGLNVSNTSKTFVQCDSANEDLAGDVDADLGSGGQNGQQFKVTFTEGFPSAWKENNIQTHLTNLPVLTPDTNGNINIGGYTYPTPAAQDIPGVTYYSESGFMFGTAPNVPSGGGAGLINLPSVSPQTLPGNVHNILGAGAADQGTRLMLSFGSVPNGAQVFVPALVPLTNTVAGGAVTGIAVLLAGTNANGAGAFGAATPGANGLVPVSLFGGSGTVVYEVVLDDPFNTEQMQIPVAVAFASNTGSNLPAPGVQATVLGSFAPLSNVGVMSSSAPIPRFVPSTAAKNAFIINKCTCNILFPFVTNQAGFDTGIAISNTSQDPFGTSPQEGTVTLNYYSASNPPSPQTTNAVVPAGDSLTFTLSGGGNFGIQATPGFQGYIIAQAQFQWCHGFAFITDVGAQRIAQGYLGLVLSNGLSRNLPNAESLGQ